MVLGNDKEYTLEEIEDLLAKALGPKLQEILSLIKEDPDKYLIQLPSSDHVDWDLEDLAILVAKSSNAYGRITRLAGMAKAEYKIAKGRFDRKYKQSREGANSEERQANAMKHAEDEHTAMTIAEAAYSLLENLENGARVASESARKIYDKVTAMYVAQGRESHGAYEKKDFEEW